MFFLTKEGNIELPRLTVQQKVIPKQLKGKHKNKQCRIFFKPNVKCVCGCSQFSILHELKTYKLNFIY